MTKLVAHFCKLLPPHDDPTEAQEHCRISEGTSSIPTPFANRRDVELTIRELEKRGILTLKDYLDHPDDDILEKAIADALSW